MTPADLAELRALCALPGARSRKTYLLADAVPTLLEEVESLRALVRDLVAHLEGFVDDEISNTRRRSADASLQRAREAVKP